MGGLPFLGFRGLDAHGLDPLEQGRGGLVVGVLGDELAEERFFQD
ncbi:hypothetical protein C357_01221 [Citreicella sp. 357]|nr:hypothetical protein C357_01221 [Citreicella sp. 357]